MSMLQEGPLSSFTPAGHTGAFLAIVVAWLGFLTPALTAIATLISIVWFFICVWESATCKGWRMGVTHWKNNWIMRHRARVLAKLRAQELKTQAKIKAAELLRAARQDARNLVASASATAASVVAHEPVATATKIPPVT